MRQTKPALFLRFWFPEYYEDFKLPAEAANDASPACAKAPETVRCCQAAADRQCDGRRTGAAKAAV
ncbi:MAG: hypothetical protein B7X82_04105 [Hydrogenophilales bacterium 17-64-65]|nr:MAG: hypothetical protein B7X82_04105 [Hydrogenophilales bacterium 17-64-65]